MQILKERFDERKDEILKLLLALIIILSIIILYFIYKNIGGVGDISEKDSIEDLLLEKKVDDDIILELDPPTSQVNDGEVNQEVVVDVKGAVEVPGVYKMELDSRVIDCIEKAGGFLSEAEQKSVNLAQRVEDQMVIYIPMEGEEITEYEQFLSEEPINSTTQKNNKLDLNQATKEELKRLNGIGDTKAENIINYREVNGPFQKIEDITNVSGIGEATFEKLKEAIQVVP